jgi:replication factor A1
MKISELRAGQGSVNIEATVIEMGETREFNKYGRVLKVANAMIKDDSGSIKLSLWNDDIDRVKVGNTIKITNGYVSEFQGEKQLTTGKFGKLEVSEGKPSTISEEKITEEKISDSNISKGETMKKKEIVDEDEEEDEEELEIKEDGEDTEDEEEEEEEEEQGSDGED